MDLPDPGIEPESSSLQEDFLPTELSGKPPSLLEEILNNNYTTASFSTYLEDFGRNSSFYFT